MAITQDDLVVLTVAMIQEHGIMDTMQIKGTLISEAKDLIEIKGKGHVALMFTSDPAGEYLNITCLFGKEQRDEWTRMGMSGKMGKA